MTKQYKSWANWNEINGTLFNKDVVEKSEKDFWTRINVVERAKKKISHTNANTKKDESNKRSMYSVLIYTNMTRITVRMEK